MTQDSQFQLQSPSLGGALAGEEQDEKDKDIENVGIAGCLEPQSCAGNSWGLGEALPGPSDL